MNKIKYNDVFSALSDSNRLKILSIINESRELCTCKILEQLNITQPTLVYHMKILLDVGLVSCYKKGTWCVYKIEYTRFDKIRNSLISFDFREEKDKC